MKGHIRERSSGRWAIVLDLRDPSTGARKRKWHSFAGTKRQAQVESARLISDLKGGTYLEPSKTTLAHFLEQWLEDIKARVSPKTLERYTEIVRKNVVPKIGAVHLTKLRPAQIAATYAAAMDNGRRDGKGGLSASTVLYMHRILKQALGQAVRWELLLKNPTDAVDPPKLQRATMSTYDMSQTVDLLAAVAGSRLEVPILLGILCGLRRGEIAALRWRQVDLAAAQISVVESAEQTADGVRYKAPKSGKARTVAISAAVVERLKSHRIRQAEELLRFFFIVSDSTFIYTREDGQPIQPRTLSQAWRQMIAGSELPRIRFHDLRHAHATHLLASGVHPKVASERLGHSKVGITLDLYSHVLPGMQADAAARVDDAMRQEIEKRSVVTVPTAAK